MFHQSITNIDDTSLKLIQQAIFEKGFYCIDNFISEKGIKLFENEIDLILKNQHDSNSVFGKVMDSEKNVLVMNKIDKVSDFFFDVARSVELQVIAEYVLGKSVMPLLVEYFSKPANSNHQTPPHQDHIFYQDHFDDELAISFWIALDEVTLNNAPLEYIPRSTHSLISHIPSDSIDFDYELLSSENESSNYVKVPVKRGGCIIHHSYVVHKTNKNTTEFPRRAVVFNYRGSPYKTWLKSLNSK
jgi:ectoine hydroxylase-related dioxygenase (phytanoyl-CoA dioxygenase family)